MRAEPIAQSDIIAITASADIARGGPGDRQRVRRGGGRRADRSDARADRRAPAGAARRTLDAGDGDDELADQIRQLELLRAGDDPTIEVETLADLPTSPVSPRPLLSVAGGLLAGLILGVAVAFASRVLDPRLRREEQLRQLYRLPILARIPQETAREATGRSARERSPPSSLEAYRALRATLAASPARGGGSRVLLVTGPAPSEGKTTTAINLATSLLAAGNRVILIEGDLRRPGDRPGARRRAQARRRQRPARERRRCATPW